MNYTKEPIVHLTALIKGDDNARAWLQKNNFPELILFHFALNGREEAIRKLAEGKYVELTAFTHAVVNGDARAANWLAENNKFIWAAMASIINKKDKGAEAWLMRHNYPHFLELARTILQKEQDEQDEDILGMFRKFIRSVRKK